MCKLLQSFDDSLDYREMLQVDGAFAVSHINYGKSPRFNGYDARKIACGSRKGSLSSVDHIDDVLGRVSSFNGTESRLEQADKIELWENYWLEYVHAFDALAGLLPESIVTLYIGRQAIELGLKHILLTNGVDPPKTHNLGALAQELFSQLSVEDDYMEWVDVFCDNYCRYIEGEYAEYFRFPQYKNAYFAGNRLDIKWLSYEIALVLMKLLHYAKLD